MGIQRRHNMSFYITLPCSASRSEYPDNRIGHYITNLARPVELNGSWEVALSEIILPPARIRFPPSKLWYAVGEGHWKTLNIRDDWRDMRKMQEYLNMMAPYTRKNPNDLDEKVYNISV